MTDIPSTDALPARLAALPHQTGEVDHLGLKLRYHVWGSPAQPAVLLQHGGKDHARSWDWVVVALANTHCLIVPDLRGHGDSDWVPGAGYEMFDLVADMAVILEDARARWGIGRVDLVGHSLGGVIATHFAAACPDKVSTLINIEGLGMSRGRYAKWQQEALADKWGLAISKRLAIRAGIRRGFATLADAAAVLAKTHPGLPAADVAYLAEHGLRPSAQGLTWKHDPALSFIILRPQPPEVTMRVSNGVTCPTLLMYGQKSFFGPVDPDDERFAAFPVGRVVHYDDAGHWLQHDRRVEFITDLRRFWAQTGESQ